MDNAAHPGPLLLEKFLALAFKQQLPRAVSHEHAETSSALDEILVHQFLIPLEDRERIHSIVGRYRAHRWQWIPLLENPLKDHGNHPVAKLAVNRLILIPLTIHQSWLAILLFHLRYALKIEVGAHRLVAGHHESPVFCVVIRVDSREQRVI